MEREILFKGKSIHYEDWFSGSLLVTERGDSYIVPAKEVVEKGLLHTGNLVYDDSVSQYIGIANEDGIKLFEGDYDTCGRFIYHDNNGWIIGLVDIEEKEIITKSHCSFGYNILKFKPIGHIFDLLNN